MKLMKVLRSNYLWRNIWPGRERTWETWRWLGHSIWSGAEDPGFWENVMETLFLSYLLRSLLRAWSSSVFHVLLTKDADVSDDLNVTTKI